MPKAAVSGTTTSARKTRAQKNVLGTFTMEVERETKGSIRYADEEGKVDPNAYPIYVPKTAVGKKAFKIVMKAVRETKRCFRYEDTSGTLKDIYLSKSIVGDAQKVEITLTAKTDGLKVVVAAA